MLWASATRGVTISVGASDQDFAPHISKFVVISTAGNLKVTTMDDQVVTYTVPVGVLPIRVKKVWQTTTAVGSVWF